MKAGTALLLVIALTACSGKPEGVVAVGTLERDRAELRAPVAERVVERFVDDGATVTRGEPLLQLDPAGANARLAQRQAQWRRAAAQLAEIRRGARQERLDQSRAALAAAETRRDQALTELRRQEQLREQQLASDQAVDAARERWRVAAAEARQAHAQLTELLNGATPEELEQAIAGEQAAAAAVDEQRVRLDELTARAPYDGRVEQVLVEAGDRPAAGAPLATVYRAGAPYARVFLPAEVKQSARPGDTFAVLVDGRGCYRGRLRYIAAEAAFTPYFALREEDRGRLVYRAELQLDDAAADLPTGIPVSVLARAGCGTQ